MRGPVLPSVRPSHHRGDPEQQVSFDHKITKRKLSANDELSLKNILLLYWINDQTLPLIQTWRKILWWHCYASPPRRLTSLIGWPLTEKKTVHHTRLGKYFNEKKMVFQLWIRLVFVKRSPDSGIAGQVSEVGLAGLFVAWGHCCWWVIFSDGYLAFLLILVAPRWNAEN